MANYYTQGSFIVPCTKEQAEIAIKALDHLKCELSTFARKVIEKPDSESLNEEERIIKLCYFGHPEYSEDVSLDDYDYIWGFSSEAEDEGLWIYGDESLDSTHAAIFTQAVLSAFDIDKMVEIQVSYLCDKPRSDGFGGHACVVTKSNIRCMDLSNFISAEIDAFENNYQCFVCTYSANKGILSDVFLVQVKMNNDVAEYVNERLSAIYNRKVSNADLTIKEVTPFEYATMKEYLRTI